MAVNITETKVRLIETKEVYEEFKYFKNIYTKINFADRVILKGDKENDRVMIQFLDISPFTYFIGYLYGKTHFLNWLKKDNKRVSCKFENLISLGKALKKNVDDVEYDEDYFCFHFNKKDGDKLIMACIRFNKEQEEVENKFKDAIFGKEFIIDEAFLKSDIFQVYEDNGELSQIRTSQKIIEIPKERIFALIKDQKLNLKFTNVDDIGSRLISLSSKSDELGLELVQYFKTI